MGHAQKQAAKTMRGRINRRADPFHLTTREIECLAGVAQGLTDRQIATRLGIAHETVRNYLHKCAITLHTASRTESVQIARQHGMLPPEDKGDGDAL